MNVDFVTIVSGLPRSGTSMMMQALEAGGMPLLTDNVRTADADNPKGYYEFEPVKKTKSDPSWLAQAPGKAVKMVYRLLYDLPKDHEYRVVFMHRNMDEIMASQQTMLDRSGQKGAGISDGELAALFSKDLDSVHHWLDQQKEFSAIFVDYRRIVEDPLPPCQQVNAFLGGILDTDRMAAVVDASLYRNRR